MNDEELRSQFSLLVGRVPVNADAEPLVRRRARGLRRRRSSAAAGGIVLLATLAVAVPETLHHQSKSAVSSLGAGLTSTCEPAAVRAAGQYGAVERMYATVTTASALTTWRAKVGGSSALVAALAPTDPVPLCLLVGRLDGPSGGADEHYALLSVVGRVAEDVYVGPTLPDVGPMPGVDPSQITPWAGPVPRPAGVTATPSATLLTSVPTPSAGPQSEAATEVPSCTSHDLSGVLRGISLVDGQVQGAIDISTRAPAGCVLQGSLRMAVLTSGGDALPVPAGGLAGPTNGVYAPMPVDVVLAPVPPGHTAAEPNAGQLLRVIVGDDGGTACAAKDRQARPASFRLTIGGVVLTVANLDAAATAGQVASISGCPGRFYAGSAMLQ